MGVYMPDIKPPKDEPGAFKVIVMYVGADGKLRAKCEGTHELVSVPPHGRLIDAEKLGLSDFDIVRCEGDFKEGLKMLLEKIDEAPTVIPASEEGE